MDAEQDFGAPKVIGIGNEQDIEPAVFSGLFNSFGSNAERRVDG
jgi:hypothetical protein